MLFLVACGGEQSLTDGGSDAGQMTSCSTKPFGNYTGTECDGGGFGSFTFYSDGGVTWQQAGPYQCSTDAMECTLLMTCSSGAGSSAYVFELQSSNDARTLSGSVLYQGRTLCTQLVK